MMIFSRMGKVCSFEGDNCGVNDIRVGYPGDRISCPPVPTDVLAATGRQRWCLLQGNQSIRISRRL